MKRAREAVNEFWNLPTVVDNYDRSDADRRREEKTAWQAELRRVLPEPPAQIVDLGCGPGHIAILLAELGYEVRGIDAAPNMLAAARRDAAQLGLRISFDQGDAHDPPGEPASADAITARHLFWTLEQPAVALAGAFRLLRPGGRLVLAEGLFAQHGYDHGSPDEPWYEDSVRLYSDEVQTALPLLGMKGLEPLAVMAREAGFVDVEVEPAAVVARYQDRYPSEAKTRSRFLILTARKPA